MHLTSGLMLGAAAVGSALLIPEKAAVEQFERLAGKKQYDDAKHRVVTVDCLGCFEDGSDGSLIYDLTATQLGKPRFLINGGDFTPLNIFAADDLMTTYPSTVRIPLVAKGESADDMFFAQKDVAGKEVEVTYNLFSEQHYDGQTGEVIKVVFDPTTVDGRWVMFGQTKGLEVDLKRDEKEGGLSIVDVHEGSPDDLEMDMPLLMEFDEDGECKGYLCGLFEKVEEWGKAAEEKVSGWGKGLGQKFGCHGNGAGGNAPAPEELELDAAPVWALVDGEGEEGIPILVFVEDEEPPRPHHDRPHHHGHHDHHGRPHRFTDEQPQDDGITFTKVVVHVLWPIAVGVGAGMLVSFIGMLIGHVLVLAYHAVRGTQPASCRHHEDADEEGAKALLADEPYTDAPPQYEAEKQ